MLNGYRILDIANGLSKTHKFWFPREYRSTEGTLYTQNAVIYDKKSKTFTWNAIGDKTYGYGDLYVKQVWEAKYEDGKVSEAKLKDTQPRVQGEDEDEKSYLEDVDDVIATDFDCHVHGMDDEDFEIFIKDVKEESDEKIHITVGYIITDCD